MLTRSNPYFGQVELLVALVPLVGQENCFALKGGTAINLFVRDLPRISVDLDLTFLPVKGRAQSLARYPQNREYQWMRSGRRLTDLLDSTSSEPVNRIYGTGSCYET